MGDTPIGPSSTQPKCNSLSVFWYLTEINLEELSFETGFPNALCVNCLDLAAIAADFALSFPVLFQSYAGP